MVFDLLFLQRLVVICLLIFIVWAIVKKAWKAILFCFCILVIMQAGYYLSSTAVNDYVPLDKYFKYDVITSITSIWDNTDKVKLEEDINNITDKTIEGADKIIESADDLIDKYNSEELTETIETTTETVEKVGELTNVIPEEDLTDKLQSLAKSPHLKEWDGVSLNM